MEQPNSSASGLNRKTREGMCGELAAMLRNPERHMDYTEEEIQILNNILDANERHQGVGMLKSFQDIDMALGGEGLHEAANRYNLGSTDRGYEWRHQSYQFYLEDHTLNGALIMACREGRSEAATQLVEHDADPNSDGGIPICYAVAGKHHDIADMLIKHGADVNAGADINRYNEQHPRFSNVVPDSYEYINRFSTPISCHHVPGMPLRIATINGDIQMMERLVEHGADINAGINSPIYLAVHHDRNEAARYLLANGADLHAGKNPVPHAVITMDAIDLFESDVARGISYGSVDEVFAVAAHKSPTICEWALKNGADVHRNGDKALIDAIVFDLPTVDVLIKHGADVNVDDGRPLNLAALEQNNPELTKKLLDAGAEPSPDHVQWAKGEVKDMIQTHYEHRLLKRHLAEHPPAPAPSQQQSHRRRL